MPSQTRLVGCDLCHIWTFYCNGGYDDLLYNFEIHEHRIDCLPTSDYLEAA